jgi:putative glutathione S-transferase
VCIGIWPRKVIFLFNPDIARKLTSRRQGWRFATKDETVPGENTTPDPLHPEYTHLRDLYFAANPDYEGRFTVPTLWDKKKQTIVSNESSEIIRMFYTAFDGLIDQKYKDTVLYPDDLKDKIEEVNSWTYDDINNGVYKSGFATTQEAYEKNVVQLFKSLDRTEQILAEASSKGPYYFGDRLTEADVRLYTTIVRFDPVYVQHFKCNLRDIRSGYPHLHRWVRHLYWTTPAFGETTQFEHIKKHYTKSHKQINPFGITPVGPVPDILKEDEEVGVVKKAVA